MNAFTVDWRPEAEQDLASIWITASDPWAVTSAQNRIDYLLERNPAHYGQHVSEGLYQLVSRPLTVFYKIDTVGKLVAVTTVWYTP
jgi:hypothetical protein